MEIFWQISSNYSLVIEIYRSVEWQQMCKVSGANVDLLQFMHTFDDVFEVFVYLDHFAYVSFISFNFCALCLVSCVLCLLSCVCLVCGPNHFRQFLLLHSLFKFSHENSLFPALKSLISRHYIGTIENLRIHFGYGMKPK